MKTGRAGECDGERRLMSEPSAVECAPPVDEAARSALARRVAAKPPTSVEPSARRHRDEQMRPALPPMSMMPGVTKPRMMRRNEKLQEFAEDAPRRF